MLSFRLKCCKLFEKQKCPYQREMERAYLIPQLLDSAQLRKYENLCLRCPEGKQQRRKSRRLAVSLLVQYQQTDLTRIGAEAYNLSTEGIALKTNYPVSRSEKLVMDLFISNRSHPFRVVGEVMWHQFHGDTKSKLETSFRVGLKFMDIEDSIRSAIDQYLLRTRDQL